MHPRRLHFRRQIALRVRTVELEERIHLGVHLLRRAILVDEAVVAARVVRPDLVVALPQRNLDPLTGETVNARRRLLMPRQDRVKPLDRRVAQRGSAFGHVEDDLERLFLVFEEPAKRVVVEFSRDAVGAAHSLETLGDEMFRHAAAEEVEILDLSGLDGEGALPLPEPDVHEFTADLPIFQVPPDFAPFLDHLPISPHAPSLGGSRQIGDPAPASAVGFRARRFGHRNQYSDRPLGLRAPGDPRSRRPRCWAPERKRPPESPLPGGPEERPFNRALPGPPAAPRVRERPGGGRARSALSPAPPAP